MKILITGFEPFGGDSVNPSWEAVRLLPDSVDGAQLHRVQLPVVFGECGERLAAEAQAYQPDVVILCGVAGNRTEVTPELLAVNWRMGSIADNAGVQYTGQKIDPAGPDAIMTDLPVTAMVEDMKQAGLPAKLSLSAGAYVCNDLYYAAMQGQKKGGYRALFIHVPPTTALCTEETARALEICLRTAIR
ncbi:MAG: hypothetical protein IJ507_09335 [Clostridia bacterium]|nr:hypothetical protein [Clostridia bacterium]